MFRAQGHQLAAVPTSRLACAVHGVWQATGILTTVCLCHQAAMQYNVVPVKGGDAGGAWRKVTAV